MADRLVDRPLRGRFSKAHRAQRADFAGDATAPESRAERTIHLSRFGNSLPFFVSFVPSCEILGPCLLCGKASKMGQDCFARWYETEIQNNALRCSRGRHEASPTLSPSAVAQAIHSCGTASRAGLPTTPPPRARCRRSAPQPCRRAPRRCAAFFPGWPSSRGSG